MNISDIFFSIYLYFADNIKKDFEATVAENGSAIESLNSKLNELHLELISKGDRLNGMQDLCEQKGKENSDLIARNRKFRDDLDKAMQENQNLENFVNMLIVKLTDLDTQSLAFWEKFLKLNDLFASWFVLVQEEKKLLTQKAQHRFDWLHGQLLNTTSEKDALQLVNRELKNRICKLENDLKFTMAQHAEECHLAEEKIQKLESEAGSLLLKKAEMDNLITTLEDKISSLSEASSLSEIQMVHTSH